MVLKQLKVINTFTRNQQVALLSHLKILTKKNPNATEQEIVVKFLEEQDYLFAIKQPMFEWLQPYIEETDFVRDVRVIIKDNLKYISYYEKQKPYREKQKAFIKMVREKNKEDKMSRMKPTKKQISYYKALCRKHNVDEVDLTNKSRLYLKNMISEMVDE